MTLRAPRSVAGVPRRSSCGWSNEPPAVRITAPAPGDVVSGTVRIEVDARDAAGDVHSVLCQRAPDGGTWRPIIGEAWDTTADDDGAWLLRAVAVDQAHHVGTSDVVRVRVENAVAAPEPEPAAPPAVPEPESALAPAQAGGPLKLFALEDAVRDAELDPGRREELEALLFYLRDPRRRRRRPAAELATLVEEEFSSVVAAVSIELETIRDPESFALLAGVGRARPRAPAEPVPAHGWLLEW